MPLPPLTIVQFWVTAGLISGWAWMVLRASPDNSFLVTMYVGITLACAVGIRHRGPLRHRLTASTAFILGTLVLALFSAVLTTYLRPERQERVGWILATTSPFAAFAVVFLIRSWAVRGE